MGFFDSFTNIWKNGWTWKGVEDGFKAAANDFAGAGKSFVGGLWNTMTLSAAAMRGDGQDQAGKALGNYLDFGKQFMAGGANAVGGAFSVPVVGQAFQTFDQTQNELVRRPLGTAGLVAGDAVRQMAFGNQGDRGDPLRADTWRQAYNDTRRVSVGQAAMYGGQGGFGMLQDVTSNRPGLLSNPDPRTPEGQQFYKSDATAKWFSGTADAMVAVFADPTIGLMKAGKLSKLRYLSRPMNAAAIERGADQAFIGGDRANKLFDYYRSAPNADVAQQTIFNRVPSGGVANKVLFDTAKIEDPTEARNLFNQSLLHMWGDPNARDELAKSAPRLAKALGTTMANGGRFSDVAKEAGTNPVVDAIVNARRQTDAEAFVDDVANGRGLYGKADGILIDQAQPRLALTSQWRAGIHQYVNGGATTFMAPAINRLARPLTPTATFSRIVNFEDPGPTPVENLRSNWEGARVLPPEELAKHVQGYATATTAEARYAAFTGGENAIFKAIAQKYGYSQQEAERVMATVNSMRDTTKAAFSQSRRYMSNDIRKLAQELWDNNQFEDSARLTNLADEHTAAVARGEQPAAHLSMYDPDGNNVLIPDDTKWDVSTSPISPTQHADVAAAMDWRLLHQALWWEKRGPIGQKAYTVLDRTRALAESAMSVWKVGQILRPGYAPRMLSDESGRAMAVIGAAPMFARATAGLANLAQNTWSRGRLVQEEYAARRAARGVNSHEAVDAVDDEVGVTHTDLADESHAEEVYLHPNGKLMGKARTKVVQNYGTLGKAVSDGVISPTDYVDATLHSFDKSPAKVPSELAQIIADHRQLGTDPSRELLEHALWQQGRDAFARPAFVRSFLDDLAKRRTAVIDPFSGMAPDAAPTITRISHTQRLNPADELQHFEDYIHDNADELLKPTSMLHAQVMPDGFVELAVAKTDGVDVVKPTGGRRITFRDRSRAYLEGGADGLMVNTPKGAIRIDHAFDGAEGARLQRQVSSKGDGMGWMDRVTDKRYNELMAQVGDAWRDIAPNEAHYGPSWERVVNVQLGNDAVARQVMSGASDNDIIAWMRKTPEGKKYLSQLGPWQSQYWSQIAAVRKMVDLYVPDLGDLRAKALKRTAEFGDLKANVSDVMDMPTVHGAALEAAVPGKTAGVINKFVQNAFKYIGDIPADKMSRFPFTAERYRMHVGHLADSYIAQYTKAGYDSIPAEVLDRVQSMARERTAADVKKYLFDATTAHDLARASRLMVPFGSAAADSFMKWGVIAKERPWVPYDLWKTWTAPDKGGNTTDENGNHRRWINGVPRWVSFNPVDKTETVLPVDYKPKNEYVSLQLATGLLPKSLAGEVDGIRLNPTVNKDTFNTFLALPTAGPLVAVPANVFALKNPEFAENAFVRKFVLPLGPQPDSKMLAVPGHVKTMLDLFNQKDGDLASTQALAIYQTEMIQFGKGERPNPPTFAEARDKAQQMKGLRWMYQMSGFTPQFKTPYQPYIDLYHQMRAADPKNADAKFYEMAGPEFFVLTASVTRNRLGIPATLAAHNAYKQYKDLIEAHPDVASLIIGDQGAGSFSQAVYQYQLQQAMSPGADKKMRERLSLQESIEDVAIREGWMKYGKLMDSIHADLAQRGLKSLNAKGAEDLRAAKAKFMSANQYWTQSPDGGKQLNPWFVDFSTTDRSRNLSRLNAMSQIISDPRLSQRDDIRGLIDYLSTRQQMQATMKANSFATLNSNKARGLRNQWDAYVFDLKQGNLSFSSLYDRWLTGDQYLDTHI